MAKRVKSDKPILRPCSDWQHADDFVRRIGDLQLQITAAEQKAKGDIDEIKADLVEQTKDLQEKVKLYTNSLEAFAATHSKEFGKKRSKKLNFGLLGWRKSTFIIIKKNTLDEIKFLFTRAKAAACIHIKETVDKEALAKLTDGQLASVGARRKEKDVFFVEPDLPEAVDYAE